MEIPKALLAKDINGLSDAAAKRKKQYHTAGKKFLKELAVHLGIADNCDIRSNVAGEGVAGEVMLHADKIYIQICENFSDSGLQILYRNCKGRKDSTGGFNNFVELSVLAEHELALLPFLKRCKNMVTQEVA